MSMLLINEPPLQVLPSLAVAIGLNEAIVLQQIHYWVGKSRVIKDGHKWVYNTIPQWQEQFPFWSDDTVRRTLVSLKNKGLLISDRLSGNRFDKTLYYRIDYQQLRIIEDGILQSSEDGILPPSEPGILPPSETAECKPHIYTETTTETPETTQETTRRVSRKKAKKIELPDWLCADVWNDFVAMRREIKKPMTARATELMLAKLQGFHESGLDVRALLENSILNCWQDVYEPRAVKTAPGSSRAMKNPKRRKYVGTEETDIDWL